MLRWLTACLYRLCAPGRPRVDVQLLNVEVARLTLHPQDVLVFRCDNEWVLPDDAATTALMQEFERHSPGHKCLFLHGIVIDVLAAADAPCMIPTHARACECAVGEENKGHG